MNPPDADDDPVAGPASAGAAPSSRPTAAAPSATHATVSPGRTLLPSYVASAVTLATRSTSFAIQAGAFIGSIGFDAAKFTTVKSLEYGRDALGIMLMAAGRDVLSRPQSELARADTESIIERSLASVHYAMTQAVFWTSTGFHISRSTMSMMSELSQLALGTMDQLFGATDTSRAIAAIVTLIRREFQNPATGAEGEQVGVTDLVLGLFALAYLQRASRRFMDEEARQLGYEEVVWDVVVLDDGERIDVNEDTLYGQHRGSYHNRGTDTQSILVHEAGSRDGPQVLSTQHLSSDEDEDDLPEIRLKKQIISSLPADTTVFMSTSTSTTKTITVDISGPQPLSLSPPAGVEVVEERQIIRPARSIRESQRGVPHAVGEAASNTYRVVYKVDRRQTRGTLIQGLGHGDQTPAVTVLDHDEDGGGDEDETSVQDLSEPLPTLPDGANEQAPAVPRRSSSRSARDNATTISDIKAQPQPSGTAIDSMLPLPLESRLPTSRATIHQQTTDTTANQKKQRSPLFTASPPSSRPDTPVKASRSSLSKPLPKKPDLVESSTQTAKASERKGGLRQAFKPSLSKVFNREPSSTESKPQLPAKPKSASRSNSSSQPLRSLGGQVSIPAQSRRPATSTPRDPHSTEHDRGSLYPRPSSRASLISVHERRRDSIVSQTDTFSLHSVDNQGRTSPAFVRSEAKSQGAMTKSRSEKDIVEPKQLTPSRHHRRARSHVPSLYSLASNDSQMSLASSVVLASAFFTQPSAYGTSDAIRTLRRTGMVESIFPQKHILRNITRYMLFSSAAYGSNFLRFIGITKDSPPGVIKTSSKLGEDEMHQQFSHEHQHEIHSFTHHTDSQPDSVLLASWIDPQGGTDSTGATNTGMPLVHYLSLDHESRAVVLACRGTLGFQDVLADMTCDYDDLIWRGRRYEVHKGIHASARRLLYGVDGRVLLALKEALERYPEYGLVLCGHSLGGAVTALLGVMLAEASASSIGFVISAQQHQRMAITDGTSSSRDVTPPVVLPAGRPIHVYAYGPPGTMSPALRKATRGLITTVVHGNDLVPFLSLGVLHDFQATALTLKRGDIEVDGGGRTSRLDFFQRVRLAAQATVADKWRRDGTKRPSDETNERWAFAALQAMRTGMASQKLLPPGEVFVVESSQVLRRDAFLLAGEEAIGRPAKRIVLKYVRDVEAHFKEVRFGTSMLTDHNPGRYEAALDKLRMGVVGMY